MNGELAFAYVGEYSKQNPNVPHGHGSVLYHDQGGLYQGHFREGKRHGRGELILGDSPFEENAKTSCAKFKGEWKDDLFDGNENEFSNGQGLKLTGTWKKGEIQFGMEIDEEDGNVVVYHGSYREKKREGKLCYERARDGGEIFGGFKEGKMHGCCVYVYPMSSSTRSKSNNLAKESVLEYWDESNRPALRGIFVEGRLLKDTAEYLEKGLSRESVKEYIENTPVKSAIRGCVFEDDKRDPRERDIVEMVKGKLVARKDVRWSGKDTKSVEFVALVTGTLVRHDKGASKVRWFPEQRITVLDDLTSSDEDDDDDDDGNGRGKKKGRKTNDGGNVAIGGYFFEYDGKLEHSLGCEATIVRNARDANVKRRTYFSPYLGKCIALVPTRHIKKGEDIKVLPDYAAGHRLGPKRYRSLVTREEEKEG
jgi:hypothetical protein